MEVCAGGNTLHSDDVLQCQQKVEWFEVFLSRAVLCSVRESEDRAVMFIYSPGATSFFRQACPEMLDGGMIVRKGKVMHEF